MKLLFVMAALAGFTANAAADPLPSKYRPMLLDGRQYNKQLSMR